MRTKNLFEKALIGVWKKREIQTTSSTRIKRESVRGGCCLLFVREVAVLASFPLQMNVAADRQEMEEQAWVSSYS